MAFTKHVLGILLKHEKYGFWGEKQDISARETEKVIWSYSRI